MTPIDEPVGDEAEKAAKLVALVDSELTALVEKVSNAVGVDKKWVLAEIVYSATQRVRAIGDTRSFADDDTAIMPPPRKDES